MEQNIKKEMERFYSNAKNYADQLKNHNLEVYRKFLDKILKYVKEKSMILEVGCGIGQVSNYLQEKKYQVTGIDISPLFIREAEKDGKAKFKVDDATNLSFENDRFDAVISVETLEHIPNPKRALEEMSRVLKKGGHLILRFPNRKSKIKNFFISLGKKPDFKIIKPNLSEEVKGDDEDLCYVASTSEVISTLKKEGFKIIETKPFFWPSALIVAKKL